MSAIVHPVSYTHLPSLRGLSPQATGGVLISREHQPGRQDDHKADDADRQINVILAGAAEHFQAGAAVTAAVAAALHGHRQLVRPADCLLYTSRCV